MSDVIFLDPSIAIPDDITEITQLCKDVLLTKLLCSVVDEELCPFDSSNGVFDAKNGNWQAVPKPKIKKLNNITGVSELLFETDDYIIDFIGGRVVLLTPLTTDESLIATYTFFPFTDPQLFQIASHSASEISVLIYRPVDQDNIPEDYRPAICKRFYTNVLRALILESKDFFSVSVGGRTINKSNIVSQTNQIIQDNEAQLLSDLQMLRHYNKTNRILPKIINIETISNDAFIGEQTIQAILSDAEIS
ncbi:MAG: hypothetical protein E2O29_01985 [Deltaproteobacteria bacterium]|nr:MAG: hypothetical protein E2O29_01985 [Deltaproteobacteria bacterium]